MIALVSYNDCPHFPRGITVIDGIEVLFLPRTFPQKKSALVSADDENCRLLMQYIDILDGVNIFVGKKSSGSLEIISLFCSLFKSKEEKLFFTLCDHDEPEKIQLLSSLGIGEKQWVVFKDGHTQCKEWYWMYGWMMYTIKESIMAE